MFWDEKRILVRKIFHLKWDYLKAGTSKDQRPFRKLALTALAFFPYFNKFVLTYDGSFYAPLHEAFFCLCLPSFALFFVSVILFSLFLNIFAHLLSPFPCPILSLSHSLCLCLSLALSVSLSLSITLCLCLSLSLSLSLSLFFFSFSFFHISFFFP